MGKDPMTGLQSEEILQRNINSANNTLRGYMAACAWPQALKRGTVRNFAVDDSGASISLPDVLSRDLNRSVLSLSFAGIDEVTDEEVACLAQGLPPSLTSLSLSFESCTKVSDNGLTLMTERVAVLPLQNLVLDFVGCKAITDTSLALLAAALPSTLQDLRLDFAYCTKISEVGVVSLARSIPDSVKKLKATFKGTKYDKVFDSVKGLKRINKSSGTKIFS
jgi:hypothetical protein